MFYCRPTKIAFVSVIKRLLILYYIILYYIILRHYTTANIENNVIFFFERLNNYLIFDLHHISEIIYLFTELHRISSPSSTSEPVKSFIHASIGK
jgi:hypothetical protein